MSGTTLIGLLRDVIAAVLGLAILFGAGFSDEQIAGVLLVVTTVAAFGTFVWTHRRHTGA